ncbi:hypothetical protein [Bosea sp. (in: a-proteobacteria)]|uniref:hypothetical protein n=1 Tax=Bosea sp. (in: a-proteobacteria) TaxID=1871050 RepID=UPI003566A42C
MSTKKRNPSDFARATVDVVAKRAGYICANPDCGISTVGPSKAERSSLILGEAAHIFGAKPGSARYRADMAASDRADITNALWICRNCHKKIDRDGNYYTPELLYLWKRQHEDRIYAANGKVGHLLKSQSMSRLIQDLDLISVRASQIVIDKSDYWEYRLTYELIHSIVKPTLDRWSLLDQRLYTKSINRVKFDDIFDWIQDKIREILEIASSLSTIINIKIPQSWGLPGTAGSETEILASCKLLGEACSRLLEWEESIRFSASPAHFETVVSMFNGLGGRLIGQVMGLESSLRAIFQNEHVATGTHQIEVIIDLPEDWEENFDKAIRELSISLDVTE